jgi:imidazolonepropionase-like amidohydrolase
MHWVHEFFVRGGRLTVGSDAGTQQALYGFSTIRELELMQQAGINPIDVVKLATTNATATLGLDKKGLDGIRIGNIADLIVVDGNPLQNFKALYGMGYDHFTPDGKPEHRGAVRWTIKAGTVFDASALLREVQWYVQQQATARSTSEQY